MDHNNETSHSPSTCLTLHFALPTLPTMASKQSNRSSKPFQKHTNQVQNKLVAAEAEEPEVAPIENQIKRRKTEDSATRKVESEKRDDKLSNWCHHGHRSERDPVVMCSKCRSKKFCLPCIAKWYPNVSVEEFVKACPVCCNNCNCKSCLCGVSVKDMQGEYLCSELDKTRYSTTILQNIFPLVISLSQEQMMEMESEAKVKGLSISELQVEDAECKVDGDPFCNNCGAFLIDLHRSCACGYNLCLSCCRALRDGQLQWKIHANGSIPCPPKDFCGCDYGILALKRIMPINWVANLLEKAHGIQKITSYCNPQTSKKQCMCSEKSTTTNLYSLSGKDNKPEDMQHFHFHWSKGEPIIVRDVLSTSFGLSWEPMVLWRAFYDTQKDNNHSLDFGYEVNAINCFDWSEVSIDLYKFFKEYLEGWPVNRKLEDWQPDCMTEEKWPHHFVEFLRILPFKDYTHPLNGYLNMAVKFHDLSLTQAMGPKMDIAYGHSVSKLHFDKSDTVSVLTHTSKNLKKTKMVKQRHNDQDVIDPVDVEGGAVWDVFQRQDIPKLEEYLRNESVKMIVHPLHDRNFYLDPKHKGKLKDEYGIEPWTFKQKLGDAILIPAGCPYQVFNLKSNTKVELNFVSPESLVECIRLQNELCTLPNNHKAKQQKLNIGKMMIHALDHAVKDLTEILGSNKPIDDAQFVMVPEVLTGCDDNFSNHNGWLYETENDDDDDDNESVVGLWRGHAVGLVAKELLQAVEHRYPSTFQGVHIRSKTMWLAILKGLHSVIKNFMEIKVDTLTRDQITTLRADLNEFEKFGFDLSWAHERLNMVERLKFEEDDPELIVFKESLEPLEKALLERVKKLAEAYKMLEKVQLEYKNIKDNRNKKAQEMATEFGVDYDGVWKNKLGFGMLGR